MNIGMFIALILSITLFGITPPKSISVINITLVSPISVVSVRWFSAMNCT